MDDTQKEQLVTTLRRCLKSRRRHHFWLCPKGADGEPVLLVERKEGPLKKLARVEHKRAQVKIVARGRVEVGDEGDVVFVDELEGKLPAKKITQLFKTKLATDQALKKIAVLLKTAQIYTATEFEQYAEVLLSSTRGDSTGFERIFAAAEDAIEVSRVALQGTDDAPRVERLAGNLREAAGLNDRGDTEGASALAQRVLDAVPALLRDAWTHQAGEVKGKFVTARQGLSAQGELSSFGGWAELQALQHKAVSEKNAEEWATSIDTLEVLEDALDALLDVLASGKAVVFPSITSLDIADDDDDDDDDFDEETESRTLDRYDDAEVGARIAIERAQQAFADAGEPEEAARPLDGVRELYAKGDFDRAVALLRTAFYPALDAARMGPSLVQLAKLRLAWLDDVRRAQAQIDAYLQAVRGDDDVTGTDAFRAIDKDLDAAVQAFLPDFGEELGDGIDRAIQRAGRERREALDEVADLVADHETRLELLRARLRHSFEDSSFGAFAVHDHLQATLRGIATQVATALR